MESESTVVRLRPVEPKRTNCASSDVTSFIQGGVSASRGDNAKEKISHRGDISSLWDGFYRIVENFLARHSDAEVARLVFVSVDVVKQWRREDGCKPRVGNFLAMCVIDAKCQAMLLELLGCNNGISVEERIALDIMREASRRAVAAEKE